MIFLLYLFFLFRRSSRPPPPPHNPPASSNINPQCFYHVSPLFRPGIRCCKLPILLLLLEQTLMTSLLPGPQSPDAWRGGYHFYSFTGSYLSPRPHVSFISPIQRVDLSLYITTKSYITLKAEKGFSTRHHAFYGFINHKNPRVMNPTLAGQRIMETYKGVIESLSAMK